MFRPHRFHMRKSLILILQVIIAGTMMGVRFIEPIPPTVSFQRHCNSSQDVLQYCPNVPANDECLMGQLIAQLSNDDRMQCAVGQTPSAHPRTILLILHLRCNRCNATTSPPSRCWTSAWNESRPSAIASSFSCTIPVRRVRPTRCSVRAPARMKMS